MNTERPESPAEVIARFAAQAKRRLTPCGDGHMVSHIWGSGPPLVLLHGNFGSWTHWIRNIETLAKHNRVIAIDIPGFGDSATPPKPYTARSLAEIMAAGIIELVGEEQINLVGFSFGGPCACELAHMLGPRVRKLVLVSVGRSMEGVTEGRLDEFIKWREFKTQTERDAAHRRNLEVIMIADASRIDDLAIAIQKTNAERTRLRGVLIRPARSTQIHVPNLKCGVAFIWADRDAAIGPHMHERPAWLRKYRPDARYIIIPDAGHWVPYEQPEVFNRALIDLLQG